MMRNIYHGSENIIEKPVFGQGKRYNDYGLGFYCTESMEMAKEWAVTLDQDGYANAYTVQEEGLRILNLHEEPYNVLHWLAILLQNREFDIPSALALEAKEYLMKTFCVDYENYDVIVGHRADDSYFSFAQDFINGTISYRQLKRAMHLGQMGLQYVLKSEKAFERIRFLGSEKAVREEWFVKKMLRDQSARREYLDVERNRRERGDIFITHILDEEMKDDDLRLR